MTAQPMRLAAINFASAALANGGLDDGQIKITLSHIIPGTIPNQHLMLEKFGYGTESKPYPSQPRDILEKELSAVLRHGRAPKGLEEIVHDVLGMASQPSWTSLAWMPKARAA